ncbi:MAG: DEAD/DEAH box helicase, partial [Collinsella sp.]|nr:DEAD/DEAH box helicase [Collinsella sp.]
DGYQWLGSLEHLGLGGILADDMGLGKTLQMIAHILARVEAGDAKPTLVVCPASLVYNWTAELERFAPSIDVCAIVGAKAQRRVQIAGVAEHNVVVTSYDLMRRDIDEYVEQDFARVVLDEAQYIKNPLTQVARAAKRLPAGVRFALTGTPIENRLSELWSIFDFLMPGLLGTRESFAKRFESPVEHAEGDSAARLQALVSPFVLRRVKEDVVADLPEKIEDTVMAQLTGEQRKLYLANQDRIAQQVQHREAGEFKKDKLKVLAELTKLRQICCDPHLHYADYKAGSAKLDTCMELVHGALDGGHRILLFSQFTGMLDIIGKRLAKEDIAFLKLTGASSKESRAKMVAQFQAGEVPVFLISLKAGGVGLNLTAADVVIHYDPWWNVAAQDQATDRAHRIGQQHTVTVYKLIAKDTIEERIMQMQESKRDLVNSVLGGDGISSALFTREDVLALLGGDGR